MKLTVLGSGSPEATARRASSGFLIEVDGQRLLFDCGGGVVGRLLEAGLVPGDIDALFLTHLHSDHMMDYARLVHAGWDEGAKPLRVYGPAPIAEISDRFFGPTGAFAFDLRARTELTQSRQVWKARTGQDARPWPAPEITEIMPGFALEGDGWRLSTCGAHHAQPFLDSVAFRLESGGRSFVYTGDAALTDDMAAFVQGAHLVVHWCYRLDSDVVPEALAALSPTPSEIGRMASRAGVKRLILTHFRSHMDTDPAMTEAQQALHGSFGQNAVVAEDLDVFEI